MTLKTIEIETGPNPRATVVLMHGLGADGNDFVPIAGEMDPSAAGPVRFVFPNAPQMPVSINSGYVMPAWYDIYPDRSREDEAGLRHAEKLAGIVGLSGYLPLANKTAAERHTANAATAVFLAHGQHDDVVVMGRAVAARDTLKGLGYDIQWSEYPMGHSVCMEEVADLEQWLLKVLGA